MRQSTRTPASLMGDGSVSGGFGPNAGGGGGGAGSRRESVDAKPVLLPGGSVLSGGPSMQQNRQVSGGAAQQTQMTARRGLTPSRFPSASGGTSSNAVMRQSPLQLDAAVAAAFQQQQRPVKMSPHMGVSASPGPRLANISAIHSMPSFAGIDQKPSIVMGAPTGAGGLPISSVAGMSGLTTIQQQQLLMAAQQQQQQQASIVRGVPSSLQQQTGMLSSISPHSGLGGIANLPTHMQQQTRPPSAVSSQPGMSSVNLGSRLSLPPSSINSALLLQNHQLNNLNISGLPNNLQQQQQQQQASAAYKNALEQQNQLQQQQLLLQHLVGSGTVTPDALAKLGLTVAGGAVSSTPAHSLLQSAPTPGASNAQGTVIFFQTDPIFCKTFVIFLFWCYVY